jgi:hypothetical protein
MSWAFSTRGEIRKAQRILVGNQTGRDHLGDLRVNWKVMLKQTMKKQGMRMWAGQLAWERVQWRVHVNVLVP